MSTEAEKLSAAAITTTARNTICIPNQSPALPAQRKVEKKIRPANIIQRQWNSRFDEDGDSELTSYKNIFEYWFGGESEWELFDNKYGEKFKYELQED